MGYGYLKVFAASPKVKVADCIYNVEEIKKCIDEAGEANAKLVVFPELCLTGYTCGDLFLQKALLDSAEKALADIIDYVIGLDMIIVVGLPAVIQSKLYNVAAVIHNGRLLGLVPKKSIPDYGEFCEGRYFTPGNEICFEYNFAGQNVPFGTKMLFQSENYGSRLTIAAEICEDLWVSNPPSIEHTMAGANIIVNLSAGDEVTGKDVYRRSLVSGQSARLVCGYIYAGAGEGESTTDMVFAGHSLICENGQILKESKRFSGESICTEIDLDRIESERRRMNTYKSPSENYLMDEYTIVRFEFEEDYLYDHYDKNIVDCIMSYEKLNRVIDKMPFVPDNDAEREKRCDEILTIQAMGLKKRLAHTGAKYAVIGISGGLDSTLALLVTARAFDYLSIPRENIIAVTMPGFGTTDRTYTNALELIKKLGATLKEISIKDAVLLHFEEIGHDKDVHDVTYENAQARQRTMLLMNIANKYNGMVIGTGDMSELALGWATYNGDHMSMYGVNASVPKTLVRYLVKYYGDSCGDEVLKNVLYDVLDTPVSPELLPPKDGDISQKTEDLVGPYELHDFFMYYILRYGYEPKKIAYLAFNAFDGQYDMDIILKWMKVFYRRFFAMQFKRSCVPDGPKVGTVSLSPRGDLRMPSDACATIWLKELES